MHDCTVEAERGEQNRESNQPEGACLQNTGDRGWTGGLDRRRISSGVIANQQSGQGKAEQGDYSQNEVRVALAVPSDHMLGDQGQQDRAGSTSRENYGQGQAAPPIEPCQDRPRVGQLRRPVAHDSNNNIRGVKLTDVSFEQRERGYAKGEDGDTRQNDPTRWQADPEATLGRGNRLLR